jgi:hypothetical protein
MYIKNRKKLLTGIRRRIVIEEQLTKERQTLFVFGGKQANA